MQLPLEVNFKNMDRSEAVESKISDEAKKLERFTGRLSSCRVTIEAPHRHSPRGNIYEIHIELRLPPSRTVIVDKAKKSDPRHEDIHIAIRDAFKAATRQLEDLGQKMRGEVKGHATA
jgi:ribosome-associated translation inhibitor RaiA|tara:strand:- start:1426 stop:1779 length:354 start_codon:yes stop_codon:yes gene_type:complete